MLYGLAVYTLWVGIMSGEASKMLVYSLIAMGLCKIVNVLLPRD